MAKSTCQGLFQGLLLSSKHKICQQAAKTVREGQKTEQVAGVLSGPRFTNDDFARGCGKASKPIAFTDRSLTVH